MKLSEQETPYQVHSRTEHYLEYWRENAPGVLIVLTAVVIMSAYTRWTSLSLIVLNFLAGSLAYPSGAITRSRPGLATLFALVAITVSIVATFAINTLPPSPGRTISSDVALYLTQAWGSMGIGLTFVFTLSRLWKQKPS